MAEIFDFPLGRTHPVQQVHDRFAEAIEADPDSIRDVLPEGKPVGCPPSAREGWR
jgi:hypothetical protein